MGTIVILSIFDNELDLMFSNAINCACREFNLQIIPEINSFDVRSLNYPKNTSEYDAFIITGSKHSSYEQLHWITELKEFIRQVYGQIWFFGVCFGHQIIAEALGGKGYLPQKY